MSDRRFRVLVVGDAMIDRYVFVNSNRMAPEAPIPVWVKQGVDDRPGGAANVCENLRAIAQGEVDIMLAGILNPAMIKVRYVDADQRIVYRVDSFEKFDPNATTQYEQAFCDYLFPAELPDAIIISDYDKGTISEKVVQRIRESGVKPVIVDSKRKDLRIFEGFQVLKINLAEYGVQCASQDYTCVERLFDNVVVTKGKDGAELRMCEKVKSNDRRYLVHTEQFPVEKVEKVVDVTGCGDTHTAALTFSLLKNGGDIRLALKFANACARSVVQKFGTSVPDAALRGMVAKGETNEVVA